MKKSLIAALLMSTFATASFATIELARVTNVVPVIEEFSVPRKECTYDTVFVQSQAANQGNNAGAVIVGALIGGAIAGNMGSNYRPNFSHGGYHHNNYNRDLASRQLAGAVVGGLIGNQLAEQRVAQPQGQIQAQQVERCRVVYDNQERRFYDVTYKIGGRSYSTRLNYHPGSTIEVDVYVRPLR